MNELAKQTDGDDRVFNKTLSLIIRFRSAVYGKIARFTLLIPGAIWIGSREVTCCSPYDANELTRRREDSGGPLEGCHEEVNFL
jgi:hypothetical protein